MGVLGSSTIDRVDQGILQQHRQQQQVLLDLSHPGTPVLKGLHHHKQKKAYSPYKSSSDLSCPRAQRTSQTKKESYESSPDMSRPWGSNDIIKTKIRHRITGTRSTCSACFRVVPSVPADLEMKEQQQRFSPQSRFPFKSPGYQTNPALNQPRMVPGSARTAFN